MKKASLIYVIGISITFFFGFSSIQDDNLFFEEAGEGETIIFVHGSLEDYRVFMPQLDQLKNDFRVITYSRRYNYPNNNEFKEGTPFNPETEANDLEKLTKNIGADKFHIIGHSYGGLIAIAYANKYRHKLKSLIISEPPMLRLEGCEESLTIANEGLIEKVGTAFKSNDSTLIMKSIFEFFVGKDIQNEVPPEVLNALKANLTEMKALVSSENPFPKLNTDFDIPVLIFTAEYTMPILKCTNEALINNMPKAKHVHISDASHDMWMSHPEIMSNHVRSFISGK